jgi:ketosteroid isomerase-like protein
MSEEYVEIVRRAYTAFNDGDLETVFELFDPEIEWNASDVFFDQPRTYQGRRAWLEEFLRDLMELFEEYRAEPEEIRDAGEHVLSVVRVGGPGRKSGADVTALVAHVMTFSDGQVVRFTEFKDPAEAFEAAGLSE